MRRLARAAAVVLLSIGGSLRAQAVAPAQAPQATEISKERRTAIGRQLMTVRHELGRDVGTANDIRWGGATVPAGSKQATTIAGAGPLHVYGTIDGSAVALSSDVILHAGGRVTGDVITTGGRVVMDGGVMDGEQVSIGGDLAPIETVATADDGIVPRKNIASLAAGWLVVLLLIGLGVLMFAGPYLEGVVMELERNFTRSLLIGIVGELALLPALVVLIVGLAITVLGILLIPFACVAFVLAVAGMLTLGYLAVARVTGATFGRSRSGLSERGDSLRSLVIGLGLLIGIWIVAGLLTSVPMLGLLLRGIAFAITWVALSAGFGAAILSRGGTRRDEPLPAPVTSTPRVEDFAWQTPTPVAGVAAARRPTPAAISGREV